MIFIYASFLKSHLQVNLRPVDRFSRMMAQKTRSGLAQLGCAFLKFVYMGCRNSPLPQTIGGGVNRRFQAKLAKSKNVHIIKTSASISTEFCTVTKTTKCHRGWSQHTHHKFKMADGRHLGKIAISWPRIERFRRNLALWRRSTILTAPTVKMWNFKNPLRNRKIVNNKFPALATSGRHNSAMITDRLKLTTKIPKHYLYEMSSCHFTVDLESIQNHSSRCVRRVLERVPTQIFGNVRCPILRKPIRRCASWPLGDRHGRKSRPESETENT